MVFIRPAHIDDLDALAELAGAAGVGITTLPKDRDLLARRVHKSQRSLERIPDRPGGESYLFVMEDPDAARGDGRPAVVGASGIVSKVGGFEPFYAFRIDAEVHACANLDVRTEVPYLQLVREHDGPCEIGSLFLHPGYRGRDHGRLLQLVRFLFLAEHPGAFETTVVSELRGVIDEHGRSPFWDAVGRHFFDIDFPRADHLSVVNKKFIADLMPVHPIYIPLLPASARAVIGRAHASTQPALRNLEAEGFRFSGMVDIFDAGPCVSCPRDEIRAVRESRVGVVRAIADASGDASHAPAPAPDARSERYAAKAGISSTDEPSSSPAPAPFILATRRTEFRACVGGVDVLGGTDLRITSDVARALGGIDIGESLRFAPLRGNTAPTAAASPLEFTTRDKEGSD